MKLLNLQDLLAKALDGIYKMDYARDQSVRDELETRLDLLSYKLQARAKLLELESKTIGRKQ